MTIKQEIIYLGQVLMVARGVFGHIADDAIISDARVMLKTLGRAPKPSEAAAVLTDAQVAAVKAEWRSAIPVSVFEFALTTALRPSEQTAIRWVDDAAEDRAPLVRSQKHPPHEEEERHGDPMPGARATFGIRRSPLSFAPDTGRRPGARPGSSEAPPRVARPFLTR